MEYENGIHLSAGATTGNLPPGVLYRVKATYKYNREDVDELSFEVGEIIRVIEYDDPEEQVCAARAIIIRPYFCRWSPAERSEIIGDVFFCISGYSD